jgi:toxin ParE1/3/4
LEDLDSIAEYTIGKWGVDQAVRYVTQLETACQRLADISGVGRPCEHIRSGLWRIEEGSHVLFFRRTREDVLVCRILHYRMLPEYHPIEDDERG